MSTAFGFTANNITYAAAGDMIGYWTFFPAPDLGDDGNWGRVPVWGFADVVESRCDGVIEGERLFGYLPMSTELVILPIKVSTGSLSDGAAHRAALPPVYNNYERCAGAPGYRAELEAEQMLYRPLFFTSFLIDDFLADNDFFGATRHRPRAASLTRRPDDSRTLVDAMVSWPGDRGTA